jgi:hypothetical protein
MATTPTTPPVGSSAQQTLSEYAGPYVTEMLGKTQAVANQPYSVYQGPMTAAESGLQSNVFKGLGSLAVPSSIGNAATAAGTIGTSAQGLAYSPTSFTNQYSAPVGSSFDATQAQTYMNPYLQASLNPQLDEARRQSQITQQQNDARMTQGGAFGGGRNAIMNAETQRNLGTNLANITGTGYNTAFNNAQQQFNADQARKIQEAQFKAQYGSEAQRAAEQSKQYGAGYGLQGLQTGLQAAQAQGNLGQLQNQAELANLTAQLSGGAQQRGIEQEGISADYNEFLAQRDYPQKMLQFQQSMLQGLPISTVSNQAAQQSGIGQLSSTVGGLGNLMTALKQFNLA